MLYHAREETLTIENMKMDYITFGNGTRPLLMIQGLNTRDIKGSAAMLSVMYRIFAKDFKVYLFDRRKDLPETVTVKQLAADIALAMDKTPSLWCRSLAIPLALNSPSMQ